MLSNQHCSSSIEGAATDWRQAVDHEIAALGWTDGTRVEQLDESVTIFTIDTFIAKALQRQQEGPATFSLSVYLEGRGALSINGAKPLTIGPRVAAVFASPRFARGEMVIPAAQRLHFIDLRFEQPFLMKVGGEPLARLGGDLLTEHSVPEQDVFLVGLASPAALQQTAWDIARCQLPDGLARRLYLHSKAIESLSIVVDALCRRSAGSSTIKAHERLRVERAQQLISTRYDLDWTIARLSREVGLNERKLKHGFRQIVGNSVHSYLRQVRLDAAASLLRDGHSVTHAALSVGFDSLSHFSKIFTELKGVAPSRYRQQF